MNASLVLDSLVRASIEGGALLLALWAVTRLWPAMPAAARRTLWWLGCLRMLVGLVPLPKFSIPWNASRAVVEATLPANVADLGGALANAASVPITRMSGTSLVDLVAAALIVIWIGGVLAGVVVLARRLAVLRRSWRTAAPFEDARVERWRDQWAIVLGRARVPEIRISGDIAAPVAYGGWRPGVLLPADSCALSDEALGLVFAHEMSHIRRRDPLLAWIPAASQLVFWFHPLVRLAAREYLAAREEVCDADALRATRVSPHDYGALLLEYGVGRVAVVPGAASCGSLEGRHLKRRLAMLGRPHHSSISARAAVAALGLVFVALAFAPVRWVAAGEFGSPKHERGKRSPIAYMIYTEGLKGTRGSIDQADFESARVLERDGRTAIYFRIGEDMWITRDPEVMSEVAVALEPEDRLDARARVTDERRAELDRDARELDGRQQRLDVRKDALTERRDTLAERIRELRERGGSTRAAAADLEDEMQALALERDVLFAEREALHGRMSSLYDQDKSSWAERERMHGRVLTEIARIARRAVAEGRAEEFVP